jgi:hypothetical protein
MWRTKSFLREEPMRSEPKKNFKLLFTQQITQGLSFHSFVATALTQTVPAFWSFRLSGCSSYPVNANKKNFTIEKRSAQFAAPAFCSINRLLILWF